MPTVLDRHQIAERLRRELLRAIEHEIQVELLLSDQHYARDVLLVCDALMGTDLPLLAALYRDTAPTTTAPGQARAGAAGSAGRHPAAAVPAAAQPLARGLPGRAPQPNDWARDTSGFGVSRPAPLAPELERRRGWLERWRRS